MASVRGFWRSSRRGRPLHARPLPWGRVCLFLRPLWSLPHPALRLTDLGPGGSGPQRGSEDLPAAARAVSQCPHGLDIPQHSPGWSCDPGEVLAAPSLRLLCPVAGLLPSRPHPFRGQGSPDWLTDLGLREAGSLAGDGTGQGHSGVRFVLQRPKQGDPCPRCQGLASSPASLGPLLRKAHPPLSPPLGLLPGHRPTLVPGRAIMMEDSLWSWAGP